MTAIKNQFVRFVQTTAVFPLARNIYQKIDPERKYFTQTRKACLGKILPFSDLPIVPYDQLGNRSRGLSLHLGGPIWPNWSSQLDARHCRNGVPVDDRPNNPAYITDRIEGPTIWCGPISIHFGHQVAEFSTRILQAKLEYPNATFLFSSTKRRLKELNFNTLEKTPVFFRSILDWYDIKPTQVKIVDRPIIANELMVAPQAEQLGNLGPSSKYLDLMDEHVERKLQKKLKHKLTFVSRAGTNRHFAAETYLEQFMRESGINVIRPETMSLEAQLAEYVASEQLIFSEGSALHGLQLLGRSLDNIYVLNRRLGSKLAKNMLKVRAKSLVYLDCIQEFIYGYSSFGKPKELDGITFLNEGLLLEHLHSIDPSLKSCWNHSLYLEHRDRDVAAWLQRETQKPWKITPLSRAKIVKQLSRVGCSHLIPFAEDCFAKYSDKNDEVSSFSMHS